jgi:hypothetical protein
MDFLFRKAGGKKGAMLDSLILEINKVINYSKDNNVFLNLAQQLETSLDYLEAKLKESVNTVKTPEYKSVFAAASPLLEATGDVVMAWQLLWKAQIAEKSLGNNINEKNKDFYNGKIMAAKFFIETILPVAAGKLDSIVLKENPAVVINNKSF